MHAATKRTWFIALITVIVIVLAAGLATGAFYLFRPHRGLPQTPKNAPFPIDVVCTWVDGQDPAWRSAVELLYVQELALHPGAHLYHSPMREPGGEHALDELYYSAHLVAKFMPWVRTFYLVTQRPQRPIWWQASLGSMALVLVHHDEIWQDPSELPVFNSNAITTRGCCFNFTH